MKLLHRATTISRQKVSTLLWDGDELVDVTTNLRIRLDGAVSPDTRSIGYPFDRAAGVRLGDIFWSVAYANRATKGLLMKNGDIHRELNRSFYFADDYDYPLTAALGSTGRVVVIHCPNSFDTIEVEDAETGTILATKKTRDMEFHSRLSVSQDGRYFLDAGWVWHPLGGAWVCDPEALLRPGGVSAESKQSASGCSFSFGAEIDGARGLGEHRHGEKEQQAHANRLLVPHAHCRSALLLRSHALGLDINFDAVPAARVVQAGEPDFHSELNGSGRGNLP